MVTIALITVWLQRLLKLLRNQMQQNLLLRIHQCMADTSYTTTKPGESNNM